MPRSCREFKTSLQTEQWAPCVRPFILQVGTIPLSITTVCPFRLHRLGSTGLLLVVFDTDELEDLDELAELTAEDELEDLDELTELTAEDEPEDLDDLAELDETDEPEDLDELAELDAEDEPKYLDELAELDTEDEPEDFDELTELNADDELETADELSDIELEKLIGSTGVSEWLYVSVWLERVSVVKKLLSP